MAKTKKSALPKFSKQQLILAAIFILGFGGFGVWKLAFSSAASYRTDCRYQYLKFNDSGACVKYLQDALNGSGGQPVLKIDGKFRNTTQSSVIYVKNLHGWGDADGYGVAGPDFGARMCAGAIPINYCIK